LLRRLLWRPDGVEQEIPQPVFPTGAGNDEYGTEDDRSVAYNKQKETRLLRADNTKALYQDGSVDLIVIKYYMEIFPNSIIGEGVKSEFLSTSGKDRKRKHCDDEEGWYFVLIRISIMIYIYIYV
jgi:hypothetical protein